MSEDHIDAILARWRLLRPDLDVDALGTVGRLLRVAQLADATLTEQLAPYGLQPGWFDLLAALRRSGELNPTHLMQTTMLTSGGMTKRLDRLVAAGLVERRPDPGDRRGTLVRLTRKGTGLVDRTLAVHVGNEAKLLTPLGAGERRALDGALRKLLAGLEPSY
jgi:DNA-binding MarR family transcriptional regulator